MSDQKPRGVYSKEIQRTSKRYEGWVNNSHLFSIQLDLQGHITIARLIDQGWTYTDMRPQTVSELHINQEAA